MFAMFIADTDRENVKIMSGLLAKTYADAPKVWRNSPGYMRFLDEAENAIVFIRVDNCDFPGLKLTQAAIARGAGIHSIWMAESDAYALDAFRYGAEAYLLLPATEETLRETIDLLYHGTKDNFKGEDMYEE